jgi:hypothetical protein
VAKSAEARETEPFSSSFVFDNPSFGRALRYTFADKRLGRAVFMNALVLVISLAAVQELFTRGGLGLASEKLSFGNAAYLAIAIVETVVVSLLGPISFSQLFNAERREDCFDQVVATGCSPLRILLGRLAATLMFLTVVALSALPFFIFTSVVLRGATLGDVAIFYGVLALYGIAISGATLATTVALEDAAFPSVLGLVFTIVAVGAGISPIAPPAGAAWSPFRHIVVDMAPLARSLGVGDMLAPSLFGEVLPTALVSCFLYGLLFALGIAYSAVGPDLELAEGLDTFSSVTVKRGGEASRGRRGLAASLLRVVQFRFFYENLGPRMRALGPFLRLTAAIALYMIGHVIVLGTLWPRGPAKSFLEIRSRTTEPYLLFTALSLGLIALTSAGARAAVLARVPVFSLGPVKVGRFPSLFLMFGSALAFPLFIFWFAAHRAGLDLQSPEAQRALALFLVIALYAVFTFSVGLLLAMLTTNPYSATGSSLAIIVFAILLPLGWIPLFTSNLTTEKTARVLDVSPLIAGWAVAEPDEKMTLTQLRDEQTFVYDHAPSWQPFVLVHAPLTLILLCLGLVLERRDARGRKYLGALGLLGALLVLTPGEARAQEARPPWKIDLEIGIGGKAPAEGFTPIVASLENDGERDARVVVSLKDAMGAVLARLGPIDAPRGAPKRLRGIVSAETFAPVTALTVEVATEDGIVLAQSPAKVDPIHADRLLVVLDSVGALPFPIPSGGLTSSEAPASRKRSQGAGGVRWTAAYVSRAEDLPSSPQDWTGAGAVILGDLEIPGTNALAARALRSWVERGGDLVIVVGDRAQRLRASPLGDALGDALSCLPDQEPRRNVDLGAVLDRTGGHVEASEPATAVARLVPGPRDRILDTDGTGEVVALQRPLGNGRLTLLGYDPWQLPFLHRDGTHRIFERVLAGGPRYSPRTETIFNELSQLRIQPARIGPAFGALLLYALFLGPGIYFALKPRKRGLLAWVLIPGFALVFAALTPLYTLVLANSESARVQASLLELSANDGCEVETADVLIFSGGRVQHDLAIKGDDVTASTVVPPRAWRSGLPHVGLALGEPLAGNELAFPLDVSLWGARYVSVERVRRGTPRLVGTVALTSEGLKLEDLENTGLPTLEEAQLIFPDFSLPAAHGGATRAVMQELGNVLRGSKLTQVVTPHPLLSATAGSGKKDLGQALAQRIATDRAQRRVESSREPFEAVLVARFGDTLPVVQTKQTVNVRANAAVVLVRFPVVFEDVIPLGAATITREAHEVASVGSTANGKVPWVAETRIELPRHARRTKPGRVRIEVVPNGIPLAETRLAWLDAGGTWLPLDFAASDVEREPRDRRALVPLPPSALENGGGVIILRQAYDVAPGAAPPAVAELDAVIEWTP